MEYPLVSVIIPTHNRVELLRRSVKSALEQTYPNIEIIIVDDVGNVPMDLVPNDIKRVVHYIRIPETYWISDNRNAGIKAAQGKYIATLDDDDIWFENYLEILIPIMEADSSIGLACTNGYMINDLNEKPTRELFPHMKQEIRGNLFAKMIWDCFVLPSLMVVRKDVFDVVCLYRNIRGEDLDIIMRISAFYNVYYTPKKCGVWYRRINTDGKSEHGASEHSQSTLKGRLDILLPMIQCLKEIQIFATIKNRRTFSSYEKLVMFLQIYYFECFVVAVHFMFKSPERYNELKKEIFNHPLLSPITILTPLCCNKSVRDIGQEIKKRMI
jgi:glycosyltransferase involved in cell wall biosynthesis